MWNGDSLDAHDDAIAAMGKVSTSLCMFVCMFVGMYVGMYVCLCVCMYVVCRYVCRYVCTHTGTQSPPWERLVHTYICLCVCMYVSTYVGMYVRTRRRVCRHGKG